MRLPLPLAVALAVGFTESLLPSRAGAAPRSIPPAACPEASTGGPGDLVRALYTAYPFAGPKAIHNEPREVLAGYFDERLVMLFLQDQACVKREEGICRVDLDLLYAAQDGAITELRFCASNRGTEWTDVRFKNFGKDEVISYRLTKTPVGWRIADVVYEDWTLVEALSQPM